MWHYYLLGYDAQYTAHAYIQHAKTMERESQAAEAIYFDHKADTLRLTTRRHTSWGLAGTHLLAANHIEGPRENIFGLFPTQCDYMQLVISTFPGG